MVYLLVSELQEIIVVFTEQRRGTNKYIFQLEKQQNKQNIDFVVV